MTIYNVIDNNDTSRTLRPEMPVNWTILSGASILQGGNPFFIPDFADVFEARLSLAVRICKLGKNIAPRFAHRYVDAAAPCINFTASDLLDSLRRAGLPWTAALNFDRSAAFGKYVPFGMDAMEKTDVSLKLTSGKDTDAERRWKAEDLRVPIKEVISLISRDNTLKTGDVIIVGTSKEGPKVKIGQQALLSINGTPSVKFNIR